MKYLSAQIKDVDMLDDDPIIANEEGDRNNRSGIHFKGLG